MDYFQEAMTHHEDADELSQQRCKSVSSSATASENDNDCFNCNICLENAHDPIVTLCGHLYCWPCIYKWLHSQSASPVVDHEPQCPVCKAEVSISTLVPLYGRGQSSTQTEREVKGPFPGLEIPCRPSACGVHALVTTTTTAGTSRPSHRHHPNIHQPQLQQDQPYYYTATPRRGGSTQPMLNLGGTTTMSVFYPMVEMLGEMMYARAAMGNNTQSSMFRYRNSYYQSGNISPRVRRQEMQADKSLNRISIFLFCCLVLCLFSF